MWFYNTKNWMKMTKFDNNLYMQLALLSTSYIIYFDKIYLKKSWMNFIERKRNYDIKMFKLWKKKLILKTQKKNVSDENSKITRRAATCCVISRGWSIDRWQFSDTSGGSWTDWSGSRTSCTRISSCWIVRFSRHNIPRHRRGLTYKSREDDGEKKLQANPLQTVIR